MISSKNLRKLIADLACSDVSVRRSAAQELSDTDERAIYPLIKALWDENYGVQDAAMRSLVSIGGEQVVYMVIPLLREESFLRNTAFIILRDIGRISVPLLYPLLLDKDDDIRKFALDIFSDIKEDVLPEKIIPLMHDPNANVRAAAIKALGELVYKEAVFDIIKALKDEEWVSFAALEALGKINEESSVGPISELLSSESEALRHAAIDTLGTIGSVRASDALINHIQKTSGAEKSAAIRSLIQIGVTPSMTGVSDVLLEIFEKAGDWEERLIALKGLGDIKECRAVRMIIDAAGTLDRSVPEDEEKAYLIINYLKDFDCEEELIGSLSDPFGKFKGKVIAAEVLGKIRSAKAVPAMIELLRTDTRDVRRACINALGKIGSPEAKHALVEALSDHDGHMRKASFAALGRTRDRELFDLILRHLEKESYFDVIEEAVRALVQLDPERMFHHVEEFSEKAKEAIGRFSNDAEMLIRLSKDASLKVKSSAIAGLGRLGGQKAEERLKEALREEPQIVRTAVMALSGLNCCHEEITTLLDSGDTWIRLHAVRALGESRKPEMTSHLIKMLKDREMPVIMAAIEALGMIADDEAVEQLKALLSNKNITIREAAGRTLERI